MSSRWMVRWNLLLELNGISAIFGALARYATTFSSSNSAYFRRATSLASPVKRTCAISYELWWMDRILRATIYLTHSEISSVLLLYNFANYHKYSYQSSGWKIRNKIKQKMIIRRSLHCMPMQSRNLMGTSGACRGLNSARLHRATTFANARHSALVWYVLRVAKSGLSAVMIVSFIHRWVTVIRFYRIRMAICIICTFVLPL